jgi:O-acetyl-ADP-ribose deacetylase (regulator of RNase III)
VHSVESPFLRKYSRQSSGKLASPMTVGETSFVNWTNKSILEFSGGVDPLRKMTERVEQLFNSVLELGWEGPPYDPFRLAEVLNINVAPRSDISEARTVSGPNKRVVIEFNPQQPASRIRFSIAHEIAHTFFPDCLERARYRARRASYSDDDWQLEMLCNVGAAEILMPTGSFSKLREEGFDIVRLMELRKELGVSTEAILMRIVKIAKRPIASFVATLRGGRPRLDYVVSSGAWSASRLSLPERSVIQECSAIGFIARRREVWRIDNGPTGLDVQAVGLPPYQGQQDQRVAGLIRPTVKKEIELPSVEYRVGNALKPGGTGLKVIAHVVNDATPRWGGAGFAAAVKQEWPEIQEDFKQWAFAHKDQFRLGAIRAAKHSDDLCVVSMVAQHGYGPSERPRIRYAALETCLSALAELAIKENRSIHMPQIGTGYGRGNWAVIEEVIERLVCSRGLKVFVYQLGK